MTTHELAKWLLGVPDVPVLVDTYDGLVGITEIKLDKASSDDSGWHYSDGDQDVAVIW